MIFQNEYKEYLSELSKHLFGQTPFHEILKKTNESHRKKRFVALYVAQDRETFYAYYEKRKELGLEGIFSQLISALLYKTEFHPIKREMVRSLGITKDMIDYPCFDHELNEVKKDLNSFLLYLKKQKKKIRLVRKADHFG